ncbi:hypothetical protein [Streptomyces sp. McG3]|uniref:hypothetical protein n=1 Tax=Streptomyces sp. McG3 TaxID=2725483 RepID=UPI001BE9BF28|nr:hypothetical protein [Streptomyces sp. McG3]MBT2898650.1 hypothetical protein [Streptomyces sp. McG3]
MCSATQPRYSGQLAVDAPQRSRSFAFVTRAHDLHHPGSLLRRSPARSGDAERAAPARSGGDDPVVRDLLRLADVMATRH